MTVVTAPACSCCVCLGLCLVVRPCCLPLNVRPWWRWGPCSRMPAWAPCLGSCASGGLCVALWLAGSLRAYGGCPALARSSCGVGRRGLPSLAVPLRVGGCPAVARHSLGLFASGCVCGGWRPGFARAPCAPRPLGNPGGGEGLASCGIGWRALPSPVSVRVGLWPRVCVCLSSCVVLGACFCLGENHCAQAPGRGRLTPPRMRAEAFCQKTSGLRT